VLIIQTHKRCKSDMMTLIHTNTCTVVQQIIICMINCSVYVCVPALKTQHNVLVIQPQCVDALTALSRVENEYKNRFQPLAQLLV
jgi:hypothetical protein